MMNWTRLGRIVAVTLLAGLLFSCPSPIDQTLADQVEDVTAPTIQILTPDIGSKVYYGSSIDVTGTVSDDDDHSSSNGLDGAVASLAYEERFNKKLQGAVPVAADGSFAFSFSALTPEQLTGTQYIVVMATDWNGNAAEVVIPFFDKTTGPLITVTDHGPGDYNVYSSSLPASLVIEGIIELPTFSFTYEVEPEFGADVSPTNIPYTPGTGQYQFTFDHNARGVSGGLTFILRANDGQASSTLFILTNDPDSPEVAGVLSPANTQVALTFDEGVYGPGAAALSAADLVIVPPSTGSATGATLGNLLGTPAPGDTSFTVEVTIEGIPDGTETIEIRPAAPGSVSDRVGNPMLVSDGTGPFSVHDKLSPTVVRVSSPEAATHFRAGTTIQIDITFSEIVNVVTAPTLTLNSGGTAVCTGGDGSDTLEFEYTVAPGQAALPLDYTAAGSLSGVLEDSSRNPVVRTLPDPGSALSLGNEGLVIDTTAPSAPVVTIQDGGDGIGKSESLAGVPVTITGEGGADYLVSLINASLAAGSASGTLPVAGLAISATATDNVTVSVVLTDFAGNPSTAGQNTVLADLTAPNPPAVSGPTRTGDSTPEWTWISGGGEGNGTYRYKLHDENWAVGATIGGATTFVPSASLGHGSHTLYVQEQNAVGNWSDSGSHTIEVDLIGPPAPTVGGDAPTSDTTPQWTWTSGGGDGIGIFRHKLTNVDDLTSGATVTTALSFVPATALPDALHKLYVQERDDVGNWSAGGFFTIEVDRLPPSAPSVSGSSPSNDPRWTWSSAGDGNGTYRYKLDDSDLSSGATTTTGTFYGPGTGLSAGGHTLYVEEQDNLGRWSSAGSHTITVDLTPPDPPTVTGTLPPVVGWSWTPGAEAGNGTYRYLNTVGPGPPPDLSSGATETTGTSIVLGLMPAGSYTLWVQERDAAGNWSNSGSDTIVIP